MKKWIYHYRVPAFALFTRTVTAHRGAVAAS